MRCLLCLAALSLGATSTLFAQTAARSAVPATRLAPSRPAVTSAIEDFPSLSEVPAQESPAAAQPAGDKPAPAAAKPVDPADAKAKAERTKKLKALKFDRRPSAILKAWATPPEAPKPEGDAGKDASEAGGKEKAPNDDKTKPDEKPPGDQAAQDQAAKPTDSTQQPAAEQTPEEIAAAKAAAEAKAKAEAAAKAKAEADKQRAAAMKKFDEDLKSFQRNVTLGLWEDVEAFFQSLEDDEAKLAYQTMMASLVKGPGNRNARMAAYAESNIFSTDDVIALADICPYKIEKGEEQQLAMIVRQSLKTGNVIESLMTALKAQRDDQEAAALKTRQIARVLMTAGHPIEAGEFLPEVDQATSDNDREALNLLSRHYLALYAKEKDKAQLEKAWTVTQSALAAGEIEEAQKLEALSRAVELAPKISEQLGQAWLDESFTKRPDRGMEILASVGEAVAAGMEVRSTDTDFRLRSLKLQDTAVKALLAAAPDRAEEWEETLQLLATNWLREAELSQRFDQSTSRGPRMERDMYGNYFWNNSARRVNTASSRRPTPLNTGDLLDIIPQDNWLEMLPEEYKPRFAMVIPQLLLKVQEEEKAFPHIEQLAETHPEIAKQLVEEFLRVWISNHDPNASRNRTNYYMFSYGFNQRANGIPLTRSKQDRNLEELSGWLTRIKKLPIEELDEQLLTQAFRAVHSQAEVYRLDAMEKVFGGVETLKPKTLAELIQNMRGNLLSVWRAPAVQKQAGTNRRKKDIEAEVQRGYAVARTVLEEGLQKYPDHWAMLLAKAAIEHDENAYNNELSRSSDFSANREQAFAAFAAAANAYAVEVGTIKEEEESTKVYETWFYASLGACDLNQIDAEKQADFKQHPAIRDAILALPGEAADRHMAMFSNTLFTRLSSLNPAVKFRYLKAGLAIVGDHKQAEEAQKVFDYYKDLITEIRLEATIDGSDAVGHTEPFGVFVNLKHTRQIEREAGGFAKYLQNQNNMMYAYNYGRPTENYRDKFQETVEQSLSEHFEVLSVTFQQDSVTSRATAEPGWRVTPYAYLLVKARGPEVDKLPSVRLDLDFLDTSGYAVIPVETPVLPLDASAAAEARPVRDVRITQTLDERQAGEGKLVLEVKATGQGLIPPLDDLLEVRPEGFDVVESEDQGVSVARFDPDSEDNVIQSERTWLLTMQTKPELKSQPTEFQFASTKLPEAEMIYQRYVDADLASVEPTIDLEEQYEVQGNNLMVLGFVGIPIFVALLGVIWYLRRPKEEVVRTGYRVPEQVTPFTVIGLLRDIQANNGLSPSGKEELAASIHRIEGHFFSRDAKEEPDLEEIARTWVSRAR